MRKGLRQRGRARESKCCCDNDCSKFHGCILSCNYVGDNRDHSIKIFIKRERCVARGLLSLRRDRRDLDGALDVRLIKAEVAGDLADAFLASVAGMVLVYGALWKRNPSP